MKSSLFRKEKRLKGTRQNTEETAVLADTPVKAELEDEAKKKNHRKV
jgi:hypothetical protein